MIIRATVLKEHWSAVSAALTAIHQAHGVEYVMQVGKGTASLVEMFGKPVVNTTGNPEKGGWASRHEADIKLASERIGWDFEHAIPFHLHTHICVVMQAGARVGSVQYGSTDHPDSLKTAS